MIQSPRKHVKHISRHFKRLGTITTLMKDPATACGSSCGALSRSYWPLELIRGFAEEGHCRIITSVSRAEPVRDSVKCGGSWDM